VVYLNGNSATTKEHVTQPSNELRGVSEETKTAPIGPTTEFG